MDYKFVLADETMLDDIFELYVKRIKWMDMMGIKQWNVTEYTEVYPIEYYKKQIDDKRLYVMVADVKVIGSIVLLENDNRWEDNDECLAYYLHNFVTDVSVKGIGKEILLLVENLALENNKTRLRLDCASDNVFLNSYYEQAGYCYVGECIEGLYIGNKREKKLK